jgi:hypothetical protein
MNRIPFASALLGLGLTLMSSAHASIYEYVFTGTVKQRTVYDGDTAMQSALATQFPTDTAYTLRFTLDLSQQTTINNTATLRTYDNTTAFLGGSLIFGPAGSPTYSATISGLGSITIRNEENIGTFSNPILIDGFNLSSAVLSAPALVSGSTYAVDTITGLAFSFSTVETSAPKTLFSSTGMPLSIDRSLVRSNFAALQFFFREQGGDESLGFVGGGFGSNVLQTPSTVTVTAVPEPANAATLAGGALLGWLVFARRPRRLA